MYRNRNVWQPSKSPRLCFVPIYGFPRLNGSAFFTEVEPVLTCSCKQPIRDFKSYPMRCEFLPGQPANFTDSAAYYFL